MALYEHSRPSTGPGCEAVCVKPQSKIESLIREIGELCSINQDCISQIQSRIQPVLTPSNPAPANTAATPPRAAESDLANELQKIIRGLQLNNEALRLISSRVEL